MSRILAYFTEGFRPWCTACLLCLVLLIPHNASECDCGRDDGFNLKHKDSFVWIECEERGAGEQSRESEVVSKVAEAEGVETCGEVLRKRQRFHISHTTHGFIEMCGGGDNDNNMGKRKVHVLSKRTLRVPSSGTNKMTVDKHKCREDNLVQAHALGLHISSQRQSDIAS